MSKHKKVLVLGIGNILWADEGFGVRTLEYLQSHYEFPEYVTLLDGGTQGVYLVQDVRDADILIVFDAIDYGLEPGTMKIIENEDVPKFMGAKKVSLHQTGFQEVLALADMMEDYPEQIILIGVQPEYIEDFGGSLRPVVKAQIEPAIEKALAFMDANQIEYTKRDTPFVPADLSEDAILTMDNYEQGRPSEALACRMGDDRILTSDEFQVTEPELAEVGDSPMNVGVDHHLDKYR